MGAEEAGEPVRMVEEAAATPGLCILAGPRGVGRSTTVHELAGRLGWRCEAGLELLADHRHLVVSRLARADLTDADAPDAADAVRAAVAGSIAIDDAQDLDASSLEVLADVARDRFVLLAWRDDGGPMPVDAPVVTHARLSVAEAEDLARAHGADDPEMVGWLAGQVPGLVLALCGDHRSLEAHRASLDRRLGGLAPDERRALGVLYAASAPSLRGGRHTWLPERDAGPVRALADAGFVVTRDGAAQLAHGLAGESAWNGLALDERLEVRRSLARSDNPLAAVEQLAALGDLPAAIARAREAAAHAPPLAASRLLTFVADHVDAPADHAAAAAAAVRLTDAAAVERHAAVVEAARSALRTAQAHRLHGRIDRAVAALGELAVEDDAAEVGAERRQLALRALDHPAPADADPAPLASLAALAEGHTVSTDDLLDAAAEARRSGDLDHAVLALAVAAAGSFVGAPDLPAALERLTALGAQTGAPLARGAARLRPIVGFHVGALGAAITDHLAELAGPVAAMHRALAMGLAGRTGDAAGLIDDDDGWPATPLWDSVRWWLRAENALLGGRLVTCRNAAAAVEDCVPSTTATVDLARLTVARAHAEDGQPVHDVVARSFLAVPVQAELVALAASDDERAAAHHAAADAWAGRHHPATLRCRIAAYIAEGAAPSATEGLLAATDEADALGFRTLAATGRRALRRAGATTDATVDDSSGLLSPRERQVLGHVAEGSSSREIANLLGVAPSTVDTQVKSAMQKLGARTRRQAAAMMLEAEPAGSRA